MTAKGSKLIAIVLVAIVVAAAFGYWLFNPKMPSETVTYTTQPPEEKKTPVADYAKSRGISNEVLVRLSCLDRDEAMDEYESALVDYLSTFLQNETMPQTGIVQYQERAVHYILLDGRVSADEGAALSYLSAFPTSFQIDLIDFSLDASAISLLSIASNLNDKDFATWAVKNRVGILDHEMTGLEADFLNDPERHSEDLLTYYMSGIETINPELHDEIAKLPDLAQEKTHLSKVEAIEDIYGLALDSASAEAFNSMLQEGIEGARKYCTPLQALLWIAYDEEFYDWNNPLAYSTPRLVSHAWTQSSTSKSYTSEVWLNFKDVVDRLNSPELISVYMRDNVRWRAEKQNEYVPAKTVFERKFDDCDGHAILQSYLLRANGYDAWIVGLSIEGMIGHNVAVYIANGSYYVLDNEGMKRGPFKSWYELADFYSGMGWARPHASIRVLDPFAIKTRVTDIWTLPWKIIRS